MFKKRIKALQKELVKQSIGAAVFFSDDINSRYFCGFDSYLIVPANKPAFAITGCFDYERYKALSPFKVVLYKERGNFFEVLKKHIKAKKIGVNFSNINLGFNKFVKKGLKGKKLVDIGIIVSGMRSIKDKAEIKIIQKSCSIADSILTKCIRNFKKFKTEKDICIFLKTETAKSGCDVSFEPVVGSCLNSCKPHWDATNKKIGKGFVVIDFGVKYKGYCSDITRTIYVGKPNVKEVYTYDKVLQVQEECINMLRPGAKCSDIADYAEKRLGKRFTHGLGHGIGLEIHEFPNLKPKDKEVLKPGMIVTVEPGLYLKRFGVRIEEDVLITKTGYRILTKTKKELITI